MKKLHFTYSMQINYSEVVAKCNYTIKCVPQNTKRQKVENVKIELLPETKYNQGLDGFQNIQIYGANNEPHKQFCFAIEGDVITGLCTYEEDVDSVQEMIFRHPHGLNTSGESMKAFYEKININEKMNPLDIAVKCMHELYEVFSYQSGTTNVDTTAEEAFQQGFGVCQDYAHIMIGLLHLAKIPARYVTGFIIGEGKSHGWVEVSDGYKWHGMDPTHNRMINDDYIRIGIGRDAKDCTINRGIMHGGGLHTQDIQVCVVEK